MKNEPTFMSLKNSTSVKRLRINTKQKKTKVIVKKDFKYSEIKNLTYTLVIVFALN